MRFSPRAQFTGSSRISMGEMLIERSRRRPLSSPVPVGKITVGLECKVCARDRDIMAIRSLTIK